MNSTIWIPAVSLAIGVGVGFGIGSSGAGNASNQTVSKEEQQTRSGKRTGFDSEEESKAGKRGRSLEEIYRKPGQSDRTQALLDFYSSLGPDEFAIEAEKLDGLPFNERILASVLLFGKWAEVDPTAAMAFTDTMGFAGAFVRPTVLQGWASSDPVNAAKYYTENPAQFAMMNMMGGSGRMGAQGPGEIIAGEWAKQNPAAAMAWASALQTNSSEAMTAVVSEVAKSDPMKAAGMIADMAEGSRSAAYETVAKKWGQKNFTEAAAWAAGLPDAERNLALAAAIEGLAQTSPELAASEIGKMTDQEAKREAIPAVAKNYARNDIQGSITWLSDQDDESKRAAMREVMPIWVSSNPAAALNFINEQASPEVKDRAAETYVWSNKTSSAAELAQVAALITDDRGRSRMSGIVAARWMQEDRDGATQYINTSDSIPDNMKQRLLDGQPMWGGRRR
jgi:hypothetical protein